MSTLAAFPASAWRAARRLNPFYSPIPFSITAEDVAVVEQGLQVRPGDRVVCVGSAGDTALSLLAREPSRLDAVDFSFGQLCEIALKAAAVRELDVQPVRVLLGVEGQGRDAVELYRRLRPSLEEEVARFWDEHEWMIAGGLVWQGGMQRLIRAIRKGISLLVGRRWLAELATLRSPAAAADFFSRLSAHPRFRLLTGLLLNRVTLAAFYPGQGALKLGQGGALRGALVGRIEAMLTSRPPGAFPQVHPFLFERYPTEDSLPPFLQRSEFARVKANIGRLHLVQADLREHLATLPPCSVQGFALLNVMDWLGEAALAGLLGEAARAGDAGARALLYSRSRPLDVRLASAAGLAVDQALSSRLAREDRIGYYRFTYLMRVPDREG